MLDSPTVCGGVSASSLVINFIRFSYLLLSAIASLALSKVTLWVRAAARKLASCARSSRASSAAARNPYCSSRNQRSCITNRHSAKPLERLDKEVKRHLDVAGIFLTGPRKSSMISGF
jgi:hypothetical protein